MSVCDWESTVPIHSALRRGLRSHPPADAAPAFGDRPSEPWTPFFYPETAPSPTTASSSGPPWQLPGALPSPASQAAPSCCFSCQASSCRLDSWAGFPASAPVRSPGCSPSPVLSIHCSGLLRGPAISPKMKCKLRSRALGGATSPVPDSLLGPICSLLPPRVCSSQESTLSPLRFCPCLSLCPIPSPGPFICPVIWPHLPPGGIPTLTG